MSVGRFKHDPYPQQLPLFRRSRAKPGFEQRALFRLQPNLQRINGADANAPRLLFKGGTSLSKAFGLISRFSEDIDITIFRDDLGQGATVDALEALSGKKRRARLGRGMMQIRPQLTW